MKSHLDIEIEARPGEGFKPLVLPDDFSISVEEPNPVFNDTSFFSYPCQVSTAQNMAVLKNIAHRDSALRGMDFEHARARVIADGLPLNSGQVITSEDAEIGPTFDFNIDAQTESFSDLIGDLECQDVDISSKHIVIGEQLGRIEYKVDYYAEAHVIVKDNRDGHIRSDTTTSKTDSVEGIVEISQALGFSYPGRTQGFPLADKDTSTTTSIEDGKTRPNDGGNFGGARNGSSGSFGRGSDGSSSSTGFGSGSGNSSSGSSSDEFYNPVVTESFINVSKPYPHAPYCNSRVAYAHRGQKRNGDGTYETDGYVKGNKKGSQIEDYGQYWCLDAFRQQSGICFYVLYFLDCLFEHLGVIWDNSELMEIEDFTRLCFFTTQCHFDLVESENPNRHLNNMTEINQWLRSHYCAGGGQIGFGFATTGKSWSTNQNTFSIEEKSMDKDWGFGVEGNWTYHTDAYRKLTGTIEAKSVICDMIANSRNFPQSSVSDVIHSLENSFGIRFLYDPEKRTVTARLLRNIYSNSGHRKFLGKVLSMVPMNEKITGARVAYSAESDAKEQRANIRNGVKDYDTNFDYIDFPPQATDDSFSHRTVIDMTYQQIVSTGGLISPTNNNVYVDQTTGNVYRVKIDSEAEDSMSLKPVLFQVGQFKGVEYGDCSEQNKEYVKEFISLFQPLQVNVINALDYNSDTTGAVSPVLAPFLDVEMEREFLEQRIQSVMFHDSETAAWDGDTFPGGLQFLCLQRMWLSENYDPTQTDTGNSPLQDIDWGLTIAIMRGAGSDAELIEYDRGYDGFDNSRWKDTIAIYEMTSDTMDPKGAIFDYNGSDGGDGGGERFSLAIRSWVQPEWADQPLCNDDERDQQGHIVNKIRSRGTFDTFMFKHVYFLVWRKKYHVKALATIAQLLDVRNHLSEKYIIDGKLGFIDRLKYSISKSEGVGQVEMDFYAI